MTNAEPTRPERLSVTRIAGSIVSIGVAVALLILAMPRAAGTDLPSALERLGTLEWPELLEMTALWALGLWLYTFVYTAALPGLLRSQALVLNLTGSLVSNLLPFGGAAGVATTYGLTWSWGFGSVATSLMVLVSGLANLLIRLVLALVGTAAALVTGTVLPPAVEGTLFGTIVVLGLAVTALVGVLASPAIARALGSVVDHATARVMHLAGRRPPRFSARHWADELQGEAHRVLVRGWPAITFGMVAYYATEALLLGVIIHALGSDLGWAGIVAAFAVSRILTAVVVTPSGTGISESATAALLVLFGVPTSVAAAAVLVLYVYTYLIEIPAGVAGWAWAAAMRRRWGRPAADAPRA